MREAAVDGVTVTRYPTPATSRITSPSADRSTAVPRKRPITTHSLLGSRPPPRHVAMGRWSGDRQPGPRRRPRRAGSVVRPDPARWPPCAAPDPWWPPHTRPGPGGWKNRPLPLDGLEGAPSPWPLAATESSPRCRPTLRVAVSRRPAAHGQIGRANV